VRALDTAGVQVNDVTIQRASLDDVFMSLTGHATTPEASAGSGTETETELEGSMA
jgi:ABC-2 type transport system ATP-binding protein